MNPTPRAVLRWSGLVVAALAIVLLLVLTFMDWNLLKHPVERLASARSGRAVRIGGALKVQAWSATPNITIDDLTLANPPWEPDRPMAKVEHLHLRVKLLPLLWGDVILPRVEIIHPQIYLHRERSGRANWTFENLAPTNERAPRPARLPAIRELLIDGGTLVLADDIRRLRVEGTVDARQQASRGNPRAFQVIGRGTLNEQPFRMQIEGGPLVTLTPHTPYPFNLNISAGNVRVQSDGVVKHPFDLGELQLEVTASGQDLAELFYLTQVALPNTPPYKAHVRIDRHSTHLDITDIEGTLGSSDISGRLQLDVSRKRPVLSGELSSRRLAMRDLVAPLGGRSGTAIPPATSAKAKVSVRHKPANPNERLLPDAHLQVERVRAMDAAVRYRAQSIQAGTLPMKQVALDIKLEEGVLSLEPFAFELQQGRLAGTARIDARPKTPQVHLDVRMTDIQLDQLKGKAPGAAPPFSGVMQARAVADGRGDSVHDVASTANGTFTLIMPHGEVRAALAELTGINVVNGLGLLLKGQNDREPIRCGVAQFHIQQGTMQAQTIVFDAKDVRITGRGEVRLGPEELDLSIKGEPKKVRLARVRTPIEIGGHLMDPKIGVNLAQTAKQGAVAAALGAVMAPAAAILAFVDPGLAKDENCAALLGAAESHEGAPKAPTGKAAQPAPAPPQPPERR